MKSRETPTEAPTDEVQPPRRSCFVPVIAVLALGSCVLPISAGTVVKHIVTEYAEPALEQVHDLAKELNTCSIVKAITKNGPKGPELGVDVALNPKADLEAAGKQYSNFWVETRYKEVNVGHETGVQFDNHDRISTYLWNDPHDIQGLVDNQAVAPQQLGGGRLLFTAGDHIKVSRANAVYAVVDPVVGYEGHSAWTQATPCGEIVIGQDLQPTVLPR